MYFGAVAIDILFPPNLLVTFSMTIGKLCLPFSLSLSLVPFYTSLYTSISFSLVPFLSFYFSLLLSFSLSAFLFPYIFLSFPLFLPHSFASPFTYLYFSPCLCFSFFTLFTLSLSLYTSFFALFIFLSPLSSHLSLYLILSLLMSPLFSLSLLLSAPPPLFLYFRPSLSLYFLYRYIINFRVASFDLQRWTWQITLSMGGLLTTNFNRAYFNTRTPQYTTLALLRLVYSLSPVTW